MGFLQMGVIFADFKGEADRVRRVSFFVSMYLRMMGVTKVIRPKCTLTSLLEGGRSLLLYLFKASNEVAWTIFLLFQGQGRIFSVQNRVLKSLLMLLNRKTKHLLSIFFFLMYVIGAERTHSEFDGEVECGDFVCLVIYRGYPSFSASL